MSYLFAKKRTENLARRRVKLETRVKLENDLLTVAMRTWATGLRGSHATHDVVLFDQVGNELWMMPTKQLGVSGRLNRRRRKRAYTYSHQLPPQVASRAKGVLIRHGEVNYSRIREWLEDNWQVLVRGLIELVKAATAKEENAIPTNEGSFQTYLAKTASLAKETGAGDVEGRASRAMSAAEYALYEKRVNAGESPEVARRAVVGV